MQLPSKKVYTQCLSRISRRAFVMFIVYTRWLGQAKGGLWNPTFWPKIELGGGMNNYPTPWGFYYRKGDNQGRVQALGEWYAAKRFILLRFRGES